MGTRPDRTVRSGSRLVVLAALICCVALVDVPAATAGSKPVRLDSVTGSAIGQGPGGVPVTRTGEGTVAREKKYYEICVPYFAKGIAHTYEIKSGGTVVDSFTYTVPAEDGTVESILTDKGVEIEIASDHTSGVNGSPSKGCFRYKIAKKAKKK